MQSGAVTLNLTEGTETTSYKGTRKCEEHTYTGDLNVKGLPHGNGEITYANGEKYVGAFSEDVLNGKGKYTMANADTITGEWQNGDLVAK